MNCYVEHYEISSHDVDSNNNVRPSIVARLFQETANHQMRDRGPTYYELFSQGKSYILVRMSCQILKEMHPYDKVNVSTWISASKGATFKRNYIMTREGQEVARAYSEWTVVEVNTGNICRVDEVDYSNYEMDDPIEMTLPIKFHFSKDISFEEVGEKIISYTECDMNKHMNNTFYPDMLFDFVPEPWKRRVTGYVIRFMKGATLGKTLKVLRAKGDEVMNDGSNPEECWCFKTLVDGNVNVEAMVNCKF